MQKHPSTPDNPSTPGTDRNILRTDRNILRTGNSPVQAIMQQKLLLQMEYACEKEAFRKQTEATSMARKVKRGDAWLQAVAGRAYYNSLNQVVVELTRRDTGTDDDDIEHNFECGRPVCFFQMDGEKLQWMPMTGTVSWAGTDRMGVQLADMQQATRLQQAERMGVQIGFDETTYQLMFDALDRVARASQGRLAYLRDLFHSPQMQPRRFSFGPVSMPWLNDSQQKAVNEVLCAKDVMVVHGPPGTGKTTTLVEAIHETLQRESQVLVCAQSNMAVDWIARKLTERGVSVLRMGNPARVDDEMLAYTYERRFADHPDYPQLWSIRKAIRELRGSRRRTDGWHQKVERLKSRAVELEVRINADVFGEARVVAATLTAAGTRVMEGRHFSTLFIDEAAQALEAACWIAIRRAGRVVLAGDHCQLPPTVKSTAALRAGLGTTLMERIARTHPGAVQMLQMQYRMSPAIIHFSSQWFYGGKVTTAPEAMHRGILDYDTPMQWIDTPLEGAREEFVGESFGRVNRAEARLCIDTLRQYYEKIGRARALDEHIDVGLISPYRAQVQYLRQLLKGDEWLRPLRRLITINTVDGFQGQERDIIVISLVRSNDDGQIGFLSDLRRMNVAITRARMKLIIIGNAHTLARHPFYQKLHQYVLGLGEQAPSEA